MYTYIHVYTIIYNLIHVCNVFENEVMVYTEFWDNQGYVEKVSQKVKQEGKWGRQSGVFFLVWVLHQARVLPRVVNMFVFESMCSDAQVL